MRTRTFIGAILLFSASAWADIPASYWNSADTSSGPNLRASLETILNTGFSEVGYDNAWAALQTVDEDPDNSSNVILIYTGESRAKSAQCGGSCNDGDAFAGFYSREHAWPQSSFNEDEPMRSDLHALFLCDQDVNGWRNNSPYDEVTVPPTYDFGGTIGTTSLWEPRDEDKGKIARAMLYMDVMYHGGDGNPDLVLNNSPDLTSGAGEQGILATLVQWHNDFPPDQEEIDRNDAVYEQQGNGNPFIDNPTWVGIIFGGYTPTDGDTLTVGSTDRAPASAEQEIETEMLTLTLTASGNEWDIDTIAVTNAGTASDAEILAIKAYIDADSDGEVDAGEVEIASGTFSGGAASLDCGSYRVTDSGVDILFTLTSTAGADTGDTLALQVAANGIAHDTSGGNDTDPTFAAIASGSTTITAAAGSANVMISEIMYNPNSDEGGSNDVEWVEIFNPTFSPVTLTDWTIGDEDATSDPFSVSLGALEAVVLISDNDGMNATKFQNAWGSGYTIVVVSGFPSLANNPDLGNEILALRDASSDLVDEVNYDDSGDWPSDSPDGPSIYVLDTYHSSAANDDGSHWARSVAGTHSAFANTITAEFNGNDVGSPGTVYAPSVPVELDLFVIE